MARRCLIDVVDTVEDLARLEPDWNALYEADPEAHYFLSWTWMSNWLSQVQAPWLVLAARPDAGSRYAAFLPLQIRTEMRPDGRISNGIVLGGHHLAGYTGFLCDPAQVGRTMPALAEAVSDLSWSTFHLDTTPNSEARLRPFTRRFASANFVTHSYARRDADDDANYSIYPYLVLPPEFETFLSENLSARTRNKARSALRMVDSGELRITNAGAATLEEHLEALLGLWQTQWQPVKGEAITRYNVACYRAMLQACFAAGDAFVTVLWRGDTPIGADGVVLDRKTGTMLGLVGSRDVSVGTPSPNFLLRLHCVRWGIENGFATYDLLQGDHAHKYKFRPSERRLDSRVIRTASGQNLHDRLEPRAVSMAFAHVRSAHRAGALTRAAAGCRQILEVAQDHAGAYEVLGTIALQHRRFDAAERDLRRAVALAPDAPLAHHHLGMALHGQGRAAEALACFDRALALRPDFAAAQRSRGAVAAALGRPERAANRVESMSHGTR